MFEKINEGRFALQYQPGVMKMLKFIGVHVADDGIYPKETHENREQQQSTDVSGS